MLFGLMRGSVAIAGSAPAIRSPVSWALLGLVIERPSYGYELARRFERTYGDALELSSDSQIYTALDALARRALVEELPADAPASVVVRQPKPHYRATAEGLCAYQDWLIAQAQDERRRSRLFARQLAVLEPAAALAVIDSCEQTWLREACAAPDDGAANGSAGDAEGSAGDGEAGGLAARLIHEEDRLAVGARLAWIEYARREFSALAAAPRARR